MIKGMSKHRADKGQGFWQCNTSEEFKEALVNGLSVLFRFGVIQAPKPIAMQYRLKQGREVDTRGVPL